MAALTATDWTVSIEDRASPGGTKKKHHRCKITLATAGEYTTGGIPIPSRAKLGFVSRLDYIDVFDQLASSASYVVKYDQLAKTLRIYSTTASVLALAELATTVVPGSPSFIVYIDAVGF